MRILEFKREILEFWNLVDNFGQLRTPRHQLVFAYGAPFVSKLFSKWEWPKRGVTNPRGLK